MKFYTAPGDDPKTPEGLAETRLYHYLRTAAERNFDVVDMRLRPATSVEGGGYAKRYRYMPALLEWSTNATPAVAVMLLTDGLRLNPRNGFILVFPPHLGTAGLDRSSPSQWLRDHGHEVTSLEEFLTAPRSLGTTNLPASARDQHIVFGQRFGARYPDGEAIVVASGIGTVHAYHAMPCPHCEQRPVTVIVSWAYHSAPLAWHTVVTCANCAPWVGQIPNHEEGA